MLSAVGRGGYSAAFLPTPTFRGVQAAQPLRPSAGSSGRHEQLEAAPGISWGPRRQAAQLSPDTPASPLVSQAPQDEASPLSLGTAGISSSWAQLH